MRRLSTAGEAAALIQAHFLPGVRTNHFPTPAETAAELAAGGLWAEEWPGGLALFHRRSRYWRLTFYLNDPAAPYPGRLPDEPVAAEIARKPGREAMETAFWLRSGFRLAERRERLVRPAEEAPLPPSWPVRRNTPEDREGIAALLRERFHPYLGCIPEGAELAALVDGGGFFVVGDAGVDGIVSLREERAHGQLRHLAVRRAAEGRGIGSALVSAVSRAERRPRTLLWTAQGDTPARRLYERHGYRGDGWSSELLLYTPGGRERKDEK